MLIRLIQHDNTYINTELNRLTEKSQAVVIRSPLVRNYRKHTMVVLTTVLFAKNIYNLDRSKPVHLTVLHKLI